MSEKQIVRVLEAARTGANTTADISDLTGMSIATCHEPGWYWPK